MDISNSEDLVRQSPSLVNLTPDESLITPGQPLIGVLGYVNFDEDASRFETHPASVKCLPLVDYYGILVETVGDVAVRFPVSAGGLQFTWRASSLRVIARITPGGHPLEHPVPPIVPTIDVPEAYALAAQRGLVLQQGHAERLAAGMPVYPDPNRPVAGFRGWKSRDGTLSSPLKKFRSVRWGVRSQASCSLRNLDVPHLEHDCGLYFNNDHVDTGDVGGVVLAHGERIAHDIGWRVEELEIAALFDIHGGNREGEYTHNLREVSSKLGVPLTSMLRANAFLLTVGQKVYKSDYFGPDGREYDTLQGVADARLAHELGMEL